MQPIIALSDGEFDRWQPGLFTTTPVTEAAAAALAFAVGVLASAVIRHVVPAMAATAVATITVAELTYHRLHFWLLSVGLHQSSDQALAGEPERRLPAATWSTCTRSSGWAAAGSTRAGTPARAGTG